MLFREVLGFMAQFGVYELLKGFYLNKEREHLTLLETVVVGPTSTALGWLFSYPQDVIKTKLQIEPQGTYKESKWIKDGGIMSCSR